MIRARPHIEAMAPYSLADTGDADIVSLAQNESAFPPSPDALEVGRAALMDAALYPDPDWADLRSAIGAVHGLAPESILCGAGSMELIGCLIRAFAGPGDRVLGTEHGYAFVATAAAQVRADYIRSREPDLQVSVDAVLEAVLAETRIVFLCNPGNPTGTLIPNSEISRLRGALPETVLLVVDQAYGEFADGEHDPTPVFALAERGDTVVLRTFSKAYGLAGMRVGWGIFPPSIGRAVRKLLNPNNVTGCAQATAAAAMRDQAYMKDVVARTSTLRNEFTEACRALGIRVPSVIRTSFSSVSMAEKPPGGSTGRCGRIICLSVEWRGMGCPTACG